MRQPWPSWPKTASTCPPKHPRSSPSTPSAGPTSSSPWVAGTPVRSSPASATRTGSSPTRRARGSTRSAPFGTTSRPASRSSLPTCCPAGTENRAGMANKRSIMTDKYDDLPIAIIGAGPVGLAAAANLVERGLTPLVFEAGGRVGAAFRQWGHIRLFSPWRHNIDPASRRLLEPQGWTEPRLSSLPYGADLVEQYLAPLAVLPAIASALRLSTTVTAVSRAGMDKTHSRGRDGRPFLVRTRAADGTTTDHRVRAVIDTSGTWTQPNPVGQAGLPAPGE